MRRLNLFVTSGAMFLMPVMFASAQGIFGGGDAGPLEGAGTGLTTFINDVLVPLVLAIAFLVFIWGIFLYFIAGGQSDDAKAKGKSLMIWAVIGFFVIVAFWGIIGLLGDILGVEGTEAPEINLPGGDTAG